MRSLKHKDKEQDVLILHLGDHDPSGIDMTRDIQDRLSLFMFNRKIEVRRIALTMEQIEELSPPPNPAKIKDSRYEGYVAKYGQESWELDALEPQYITNLIEYNILSERDTNKWQELIDKQETERKQIANIIERWNELF